MHWDDTDLSEELICTLMESHNENPIYKALLLASLSRYIEDLSIFWKSPMLDN